MIPTDLTMKSLEIEKQNLLLNSNRQKSEKDKAVSFIDRQPSPPDTSAGENASIDNLVDNSDFDYSKDAYLNRVAAGGDAGEEVFNFFRHRLIKVEDASVNSGAAQITSASAPFKAAYAYPMNFVLYGAGGTAGETLSGTLTRVSDTTATLSQNALANITNGTLLIGDALSETAAQAVKASAHTLFAANEAANLNMPRWNKTNGWIEIGSNSVENWSLDAPLPLNLIRAGLTIFVICIVLKRAGTANPTSAFPLYFGIWDATNNQNKWIEGGNFTLNAAQVGAAGAAAVQYKAIAHLSNGAVIESNTAVVANSNSILSASNYNRLTWKGAPGILDFTLYRLKGGIYKRIFTVTNGSSDYNDTGADEETVSGFPTSANTRALVYKETSEFAPADAEWTAIGVSIKVPSTYDTSKTTGKQWFRCGVVGALSDNRVALIDRLGLSFRPGAWERSSRDKAFIAQQNPSSLPTESSQGDTGLYDCFEKLTLIRIGEKDGSNLRPIPIIDAEKGMYAWDGKRGMRRIARVRRSNVKKIWLLILENGGWFRATAGERFITSRADREGTRVIDLLEGDTIVCPNERGAVSAQRIAGMEEQSGEFCVVLPSFEDGHIFAVGNYTENGIVWAEAHNRKAFQDFETLNY